MKCPKCEKGELREDISFVGIIHVLKVITTIHVLKVITTYCPLCTFKNSITLSSNMLERQNYNLRRNNNHE